MSTSPEFGSAQWICSPVIGGARVTAPVPYFRTQFQVEGPVRSAVLHITALGIYECELNGRLVSDDLFAPGWTEYKKRVHFFSYDVAERLNEGANALGVILGDGWYAGHVADQDRGLYGERPLLLAQLEITRPDGTMQCVVTDATWKTAVGPILESDILGGETYDARRELGAWSTPGYDDAAWQPVILAPEPKIEICRSPGPPVRRHEILPGRLLETPAKSGKPLYTCY